MKKLRIEYALFKYMLSAHYGIVVPGANRLVYIARLFKRMNIPRNLVFFFESDGHFCAIPGIRFFNVQLLAFGETIAAAVDEKQILGM